MCIACSAPPRAQKTRFSAISEASELLKLAQRLADIAQGKKRPVKDRRPFVGVRFEIDEINAIDAAAAARGITRSDLIREGLAAILGRTFRLHRDMPEAFRRRNTRKQPSPDMRQISRAITSNSIALHNARNTAPVMSEMAGRAAKLGTR